MFCYVYVLLPVLFWCAHLSGCAVFCFCPTRSFPKTASNIPVSSPDFHFCAWACESRCKRTWRRRHPGDENETQPYWLWEPKNCALEEVTSAKFCQAMEGRKGVLLVGERVIGKLLGFGREALLTNGDFRVGCWQKLGVPYLLNTSLV